MITWLNPTKLTPLLMTTMSAYEAYLLTFFPSAKIVVHADWREAPAVGVTVDQHCFGKAVDFNVEGVSLPEAWLALERFPAIMGVGFYPYWNNKGFHADVRNDAAIRQRWMRNQADDAYVAFDTVSLGLLQSPPPPSPITT